MRKHTYVVYKITFPNDKIYIGKDIGEPDHSQRYFGSWDNLSVEADFSKAELANFTLSEEILFESLDKAKVTAIEYERLIPFTPVLHDVEISALQGAYVPVLFRLCQPVGKLTDRCPAKRLTRAFSMRTRVRSIWRTGAGPRASSAPLAAPAKAGL